MIQRENKEIYQNSKQSVGLTGMIRFPERERGSVGNFLETEREKLVLMIHGFFRVSVVRGRGRDLKQFLDSLQRNSDRRFGN
ncbi:unnamed protein product [Camellia sinensis]